jgi:hypothetical protein
MSSSTKSEKNIVLRSRTIVVIKKLTFLEKSIILKDLISKHNLCSPDDKTEAFKKIFDFFCLECVDDMVFRKKPLLDTIKNKLNERRF